jgi:hypothetical protein
MVIAIDKKVVGVFVRFIAPLHLVCGKEIEIPLGICTLLGEN